MRLKSTNEKKGVISVKSYIFQVELVQEEDGRWSAGVPTLPGCATWGNSKEEALDNIHDAVEAYLHAVKNAGKRIPKDTTTQVSDNPVVAVTV